MFEIKDGKIRITRGDYGRITCVLKDGAGNAYTMQTGDFLTLTVRKLPCADSPAILTVTSVTPQLAIVHDDTAGLAPGDYSADIQLTMADGKRFTFWPTAGNACGNYRNFIILPEVTHV